MPYVTSLEQRAMDRGREEGRAEGIAVGLAQGLERGLARAILRMLTTRFGALDATTTARIQSLPIAVLDELTVALLAFTVPADLTAWLDAHAPEAGDV